MHGDSETTAVVSGRFPDARIKKLRSDIQLDQLESYNFIDGLVPNSRVRYVNMNMDDGANILMMRCPIHVLALFI